MSSMTINIISCGLKKTLIWKQQHPHSSARLFRTIPRSRSGRYFGVSTWMSMEEQFQRISEKVFWHVFLTSRAAWIMVCMSSRLLRHSWAWEDTMPGISLQCWVWLMCKEAGTCDRALPGAQTQESKVVLTETKDCLITCFFVIETVT